MPYIHKVKYYETDKMGITHHSNYIRWMEEARIEYLRQIGLDFRTLESEGLISPVVSVDCRYRNTTAFDDEVQIDVCIKEFRGVRLIFEYTMTKLPGGEAVATATSEHCFINSAGKPVILGREFPRYDEILKSYSK